LGFNVFPLYGELPADQQDAALRPSDRRKVILATNLAQTSLTVEGVTTVVDGGWARVARFDLNLGVNVLETVRVSRASADQRAGRAGRLSAGTCYRLWHPETVLPAHEKAEIQQQDVTRLALDLAQWGSKVADMALLDQPPASHWRYAQTVLQGLEAIEHESKISSHGKALNRLPTHPRLAHLLLKAKAMGESHTGAWVAAALEQRSGSDKDLSQRLRSLQHDRATQDSARQFLRVLDASEGHLRPELAGRMLAWAYPERIALHKGKGVYGCADGQEALLTDHPTGFPTWLAIAHWRDDQKILLYADLDEADVLQDHPPRLESVVTWDAQNECVIAESQQRLGQLVLSKKPLQNPPAALVQAALLQALGKRGLQALPWTDSAQQWQARVQCLRAWQGTSWPDVSDEALSQDWAWLAPHLSGMSRFSHLERLDLMQVFNGLLDYSQQQALNRLAPTSIGVPSGLKHGLHYEANKAPVLEVKLQELFGATQTPTVCDGKIKVLLHLLSPGRKPAAVTDDLVRFWANGYADVKKDLKGRYPRHPWPDNPLEAPPTHRAKPRGT
jgi:ATP-dependent helicase HrpB